MEPERVFFYGTELRGVHSGWCTIRTLKVERKWVTVEIGGKAYRVPKGVWGQWPRYKSGPVPVTQCQAKQRRTRRDGKKCD